MRKIFNCVFNKLETQKTITKTNVKLVLVFFFFVAFGLKADAQRVSPFQDGSYQLGLLNIRDLTYFAPDLYFYDYNYFNNSSSYYDQSGDKVSNLESQQSGYSNMPSIYYVSKIKIFGGNYIASISPSFLTSSSTNNNSDTSDYTTSKSNGFGDLAFMPFGISWTFNERIDIAFMFTVYAPTGRYTTGADDNMGKGYWTYEFQVPFYLYFFEQKMALVLVPTLEVNGKIRDADVRPGSRYSIEYGISQYITPWLEVEFLNGHNWQIGDDKGEDVWWKDSQLFTRDQSNTFSFGVGVWPWKERLNARFQYARDYGTKQDYKSNFWTFSLLFYSNLLN